MSIRIFSPEGFSVSDQELSSQKAQRERLVGLARGGDKGDVQAPWDFRREEKDLGLQE
jgi:hypothetical protein